MKKLFIYIPMIATAFLVFACNSATVLMKKDIKYMNLRFKPLGRNDITLVGNLSSETTVGGSYGVTNPQTKERVKTLTGNYATNVKQGKTWGVWNSTEFLYFAPGPNEVITGNMYDNEFFQNATYSAGTASTKGKTGFFAALISKFKLSTGQAIQVQTDVAIDYAFYGLIEKYPDVDYFINVRFDRKITNKKNTWTETVTVKADGIKLRTDN